MPIICTTEAPRIPDADPQATRGIYWTRLSVRSLGRFMVLACRSGDVVVYGFVLGAVYPQDSDRTMLIDMLPINTYPSILCYARRDPNHGKAQQEEIAKIGVECDAIYERWQEKCDYMSALGAPEDDFPSYPYDEMDALRARIRELRKPVAGAIHRAVEAALAARGLPPLTAGEVIQIKVLETAVSVGGGSGEQ